MDPAAVWRGWGRGESAAALELGAGRAKGFQKREQGGCAEGCQGGGCESRAEQFFPTASYSLVTKQAVTRGLLTRQDIPTLLLTGKRGSGSFVVVVLWLPGEGGATG